MENLISRKKSQPASAPSTPLEQIPRPTKSIILGGGHPIIVPDKNSHLAVASTSTVNTAKLSLPAANKATSSPTKNSQSVEALRIPKSATMGSIPVEGSGSGFVATGGALSSPGGKISNVDEFCPDGGVLDKSFLDDALDGPTVASQEPNPLQESDSEDENHHNPLVSRFDDEFVGDGADQPEEPTAKSSLVLDSPRRTNPLRHELTPSPNPVVVDRAFSLSSIELEIDRVDTTNADAGSLHDSESWSLDTKERRSPEGGEDVGSNVSVTCSKSSSSGKKVRLRHASKTFSSKTVPFFFQSKDKDKERSSSSKHKKSKKSSREKDESRDERRRSKRKSHIDDFVQEMKTSVDYCEEAYEAI